MQGQQLVIKTHFTVDDTLRGTIDIPQQGASGLPLQKISVVADSVFFEFQAGPGLAQFKGTFRGDSTIGGTFHQRGMQFPFELERYQSQTDTNKQKETTVLPYQHEDMIIKNDSIDIAGTLTWPENQQANTLVIMISGSGAQDRDETMTPISNFKPFALLADSLTMNGIATFRYDDRGVGKSTGSFSDATLDMLAADVEAIISEFTDESDRKFDQIILLGHSQGGVVGGKVAAENKAVDKLILMASTGVPLRQVTNFQVKQALVRAGFNQEQIASEMAARERLYKAVKNQKNIEQVKQAHTTQLFESLKTVTGSQDSSGNFKTMAQRETAGIIAVYENPQMKSLYSYDPTSDLRKLDVPVLVLFGGKDTQVTVAMNRAPIDAALEAAGVDYQINVFENANHPFQKAQTGQVQEYGSLDNQFVDEFTSTIAKWIKK